MLAGLHKLSGAFELLAVASDDACILVRDEVIDEIYDIETGFIACGDHAGHTDSPCEQRLEQTHDKHPALQHGTETASLHGLEWRARLVEPVRGVQQSVTVWTKNRNTDPRGPIGEVGLLRYPLP